MQSAEREAEREARGRALRALHGIAYKKQSRFITQKQFAQCKCIANTVNM